MANKITTLLDLDSKGFDSSLKAIRKSVADTDGAMNKFKVGSKGAFEALKMNAGTAALGIGASLTALGAKSVDAASTLAESMNAVNVSYGDSAEAVHKLGEVSAESFGLSQRAFNEAAVGFTSFAEDVAGSGGDVAVTLDDLMTRSVDFASVMNMDVTEAADAFKSALSGEAEPLKKFGINISDAAVNAHALATGMIQVGETLTDTEKVQARYSLLMEETAKTSGDFENTQDGLANQSKILKARMEDLSAEVGGHLAPAVGDAVGHLTDLLAIAEKLKLIGLAATLMEWTNPLATGEKVLNKIAPAYRNVTQAAWDYATAIEAQGGSFATAIHEYEAMEAANAENVASTLAAIDAAQGYGEANEDLARSHSLLAHEVEESTGNYNLALEAADLATAKFADGITAATDQGADGFADFSDEAFESIDKFQEELAQSITDTANWKTNLVTIAGQTSGEFATYLAELGPAAAGMVAEMAGNSDELQDTFDIWTMGAADASRDMADEFANVDPMVQQALNGTASKMNSIGTQIGDALADGIADGLRAGEHSVSKAAGDLVTKAANAAKLAGLIKSPSKLMKDEVGKPLAQGVAEGINEDADKVGDALAKAIESAEKKALDAAQDLVDDVQDGIAGFWGGIDDARSEDDLREGVADAQANLDKVRGDSKSTAEDLADAEERLEDANYRLAKATVDMIYVDDKARASWVETATAAGLSKQEIDGLIAAYDALALAKANAATTSNGITAAANGGMSTVDRFQQLVGQGLVSQEQVDWVAGGKNPGEQLAGMQGIIDNLDRMFPAASGGGGPNIVINSYGTSDEYTRKLAAEIQRILRESQ